MNTLAKNFARAVYYGAQTCKAAFNAVSGQWLLNHLSKDARHTRSGHYYDKDDSFIYSDTSRGVSQGIGAMAGLFTGLIGGAFAGSILGAGGGLLVGAGLAVAPFLTLSNIHAYGAGASYSLRKLYNKGSRLIEEEKEALDRPPEEPEHKAEAETPVTSEAVANDEHPEKQVPQNYNGPDSKLAM